MVKLVPMTEEKSIVHKATGESFKGLAVMAAGAAVFAVALVPILGRFLPSVPAVWLLIGSAVLIALMTSGVVRQMAHGAALYGVLALVVPYLSNLVGGLTGAGQSNANSHPLLTA